MYRAWDTRLNRELAIKVLLRTVESSDPNSRARFVQEAKATAALEHPYIATIFEIGVAEGVTFIAMELIRGRELTDLISEESLQADAVVDYALEMAEALAFAHDKGIVHRDLKPANVMVTEEGHIKIIDFGLAKLTQPLPVFDEFSDDTAERAPSHSGALTGTLSYMAPEQARGLPLDRRCDIFSFGVVLQEMLTGNNPFRRGSNIETAHAIIHSEHPKLSESVHPNVARQLQPIVDRCLQKDPDERYQDSRALVQDLKQVRIQIGSSTYKRFVKKPKRARHGSVMMASAAVALVLVVLLWPRPETVAILGWRADALSADTNAGQLAPLAVTDRLRDFEGLEVTPFSISRSFPWDEDPANVVDQLDVDWVVRAELARSAEGLSAQVSLSTSRGVASGWPREIVAPSGDVLDLADVVAESIADSLGASRVTIASSGSDIAREHYLAGRSFLWGWDVDQDYEKAVDAFQRAVDADESFAEAHAGLALSLWHLYRLSGDASFVNGAVSEAEQAVTLDPELAETHLALGVVQLGRGQAVEAQASFQRALELAPADDATVRQIADTYEQLGRLDAAEAMYQRAIELRPGYWGNYRDKGELYLFRKTNELERAKPLFREVIRLRPNSDIGYNNLAAAHLMSGELEQAEPLLQAAIGLNPSGPAYNNLGIVYYSTGRFEAALAQFRRAIEISGFEDPTYVTGLADTYRQLGLDAEARHYYRLADESLRRQLEVNPNDDQARAILSAGLAALDRCDEAFEEASRAAPPDGELAYVDYIVAITYAVCGDRDKTLHHMERAIRGGAIFDVETNPDLKPYLDDPALADALARTTS